MSDAHESRRALAERALARTFARTAHLARLGEVAPVGVKTYECVEHGQTIGAWHCAECGPFGNATAAEIGEQELDR